MCPQREHSCDVPCAGILIVNFSFLRPLYLANVTILPHMDLSMDLLRPAFALAPSLRNVPLTSFFTLGFLTMLATCRSSTILICAVSSTIAWLILWARSSRILRLLRVSPAHLCLGLLPALGSLALLRKLLLQLPPRLLSIRKRLFFSLGEIILLAIAHSNRYHHPSVETVRYRIQFFPGQAGKVLKQLLFSHERWGILGEFASAIIERYVPLGIVSSNGDAVWQLVRPMRRELELSHHEFPSANEQAVFLHKTIVDLCSVSCRNELEKFLCNQYGLSAKLLLSRGPLRQPFKEPRICLHEAVRPVTQDLGRHLKQPWRELAVLELAVLLVHRCLQPR